MRPKLVALAVSLLGVLASGCASTVHLDVWPEQDEVAVLAEPPSASGLPAPRVDSYQEIKVGGRVSATREWGARYQAVDLRDQAPAVEHEPLDLDVLVRFDGNADAGLKDISLSRYYRPMNVPEGTGTQIRFHTLDYRWKEPKVSVNSYLHGDPAKPFVTADVFVEYSISGRRWLEGDPWYILLRVRTRLQSDHPDWQVSDTTVDVEAYYGLRMSMPVYTQTEP